MLMALIKKAKKMLEKTKTKVEVVTKVETKDELLEKIKTFLVKVKGKASLPKELIVEMYNLYNERFKAKERDYSCSICAARIYQALKKEVKKNAK